MLTTRTNSFLVWKRVILPIVTLQNPVFPTFRSLIQFMQIKRKVNHSSSSRGKGSNKQNSPFQLLMRWHLAISHLNKRRRWNFLFSPSPLLFKKLCYARRRLFLKVFFHPFLSLIPRQPIPLFLQLCSLIIQGENEDDPSVPEIPSFCRYECFTKRFFNLLQLHA